MFNSNRININRTYFRMNDELIVFCHLRRISTIHETQQE